MNDADFHDEIWKKLTNPSTGPPTFIYRCTNKACRRVFSEWHFGEGKRHPCGECGAALKPILLCHWGWVTTIMDAIQPEWFKQREAEEQERLDRWLEQEYGVKFRHKKIVEGRLEIDVLEVEE